MTKNKNVAVRFIEEMPFNGKGQRKMTENWTFKKILNGIKSEFKVSEVNQKNRQPQEIIQLKESYRNYSRNYSCIYKNYL